MKISKSRWLNKYWYASLIGNTTPAVLLGSVSPWTAIANDS